MTERLYKNSTNIFNFLVMTRTMTLKIMIIMIKTRTFIHLLITMVNLIIPDIAMLVRAEVSSHHDTSQIEHTPTPHDTLTSTNYIFTDIILTFTPILVFLSSFRHKILFLYKVHIIIISFCYFIE